jgi:hypothetical protein
MRAIRRQLMTAARHSDQYTAVPGHDEIVAMAPAAIYSCLGRGFLYTGGD